MQQRSFHGRVIAGQVAVAVLALLTVLVPAASAAPGTIDNSFGRAGVATFDFGGREDRVRAVALQPDGKIVAVGQSEADFALVRFNAF